MTAARVSHCLLDLAPPDIAWFQERSDIVLVPIGSCEQHGAHLPLGHRHDHGAGGRRGARPRRPTCRTRRRSGPATRRSTCASPSPRWARSRCAPRRSTRSSTTSLRSLIHHGWNKLIFVNGHGSNTKVIDPLLRRIKYETGALVALYKPYAERYIGILEGLLENPPDETPGWHASELETSQVLAHDAGARPHGPRRRGPRAGARLAARTRFLKSDGAPDVAVRGLPVLRRSRWTTASSRAPA